MSFKNDFSSSEVMRSLEKIAQEKGLIKPDPIKKTAAAKKADFTPTSNLMENIFKLCAGLRTQGLEKVAMEVEMNYLNYKQAQTLYETSKEKGEDVIHAAHPDGSHKMENIDSDEATFEDILDKHTKMLQVIEKKPHGKLSSAAQILKAVKIALADDASDERARQYWQGILTEATSLVNTIIQNEDVSDMTYHSMPLLGQNWFREAPESSTGMALKTTKGHLENVLENLNSLARKLPSMEALKEFQANLNSIMSLVRDGDNISAKSRTNYIGKARDIYSRSDKTLQILRGEVAPTPVAAPKVERPAGPLDQLLAQVNSLKSKVSSWKALRAISRSQVALKWITDELTSLDEIMSRYQQVPQDQAASVAPSMQKEIADEMTDINTFETNWVRSA